MKSKNLILTFVFTLLIFSTFAFASAANSKGFLEIFRNASTGKNVTTFDNNGNIFTLGKLNISGIYYGNGAGLTNINTSSLNLSQINYWVKSGNNIYYNKGYVGIGLTNPSTQLQVNGSIKFSSATAQSTNGVGQISTQYSHNIGEVIIIPQGSSQPIEFSPNGGMSIGGSTLLPPANGLYVAGKVGIGTTTPGAKLEINGNLTLSGTYGATLSQGEYPFKGYWAYTDDGTGYGPAWIHTNTNTGNTLPTMFLQTSGDSATLRIDNSIALGDMNMSSLGVMPTQTILTYIGGSSNSNTYFNTGGKVGIGTSSPNQRLQVTGNVNAYQYLVNGTPISAGSLGALTGSGTANYIPVFNGTKSITNSVIYQNGGNVGIGTTSSAQKLTVSGSINSSGTVYSYASGGGHYVGLGTNGGFPALVTDGSTIRVMDRLEIYGRSGTHYLSIRNDTGTPIMFNAIGNSYVNYGNVGVGTSNPTSKLQVQGTMNVSSSGTSMIVDSSGNVRIGI